MVNGQVLILMMKNGLLVIINNFKKFLVKNFGEFCSSIMFKSKDSKNSKNIKATEVSQKEENNFDTNWEIIYPKIENLIEILDKEVLKSTITPTEYSIVYTKAYDICTMREYASANQERIYNMCVEMLENYVNNYIINKVNMKEDCIDEFIFRFSRFDIFNKWISKFFTYLDRNFVRTTNKIPMSKIGYVILQRMIFSDIHNKVKVEILKLINNDRENYMVDYDRLKKCTSIFINLDNTYKLYNDYFEKYLLENTEHYFNKKGQEMINTYPIIDYVNKVNDFIKKELVLSSLYLIPQTGPKLETICINEMIVKHTQTILEKEGSGFNYLIDNDKFETIGMIYTYFNKVDNGLINMSQSYKVFLMNKCRDIINIREEKIKDPKNDNTNDSELIELFINYYNKYNEVTIKYFDSNNLFSKVFKGSMEELLNKKVGKYSFTEIMCVYVDKLLKTPDQNTEEKLNTIVDLFIFIQDKDLFGEIYKNYLSKRLLSGKFYPDTEKFIISKLKLICGNNFVSKYEGMINDLSLANDVKTDYANYANSKLMENDIDFSVKVLTSGYWPTFKNVNISIPNNMAMNIDNFVKYYEEKNPRKVLTWMHSLGQVEIKFNAKKVYTINVTTLQAVVLILFNENNNLYEFQEIQKKTNMETDVLKKVLHSLTCGKFKILLKSENTNKISESEVFKLNANFSNSLRKFNIPMPSLEETHNTKKIEEDRSFMIDAAIVRIMKARKVLPHTELMSEVFQQLMLFKPEPTQVRKRIEALIEREYLERNENDSKMYNYLA